MHSCIYQGYVFHRRNKVSQDDSSPKSNHFKYPISYFYFDLSELDKVFNNIPFASINRPNILSFSLSKYLSGNNSGNDVESFREEINNLIQLHCNTILPKDSQICILTFAKQFGYTFNPVSIFYILNHDYTKILWIILQVSNTPWLEKHCYILPFIKKTHNNNCNNNNNKNKNKNKRQKETIKSEMKDVIMYTCRWPKAFHVSPFYDMKYEYQWSFGVPNENMKSFGFLKRSINENGININTVNSSVRKDKSRDVDWTKNIKKHSWGTSSLARMIDDYDGGADDNNHAYDNAMINAFCFGFERMQRKEINLISLIEYCLFFPVMCCLVQFWIHFQAVIVFCKGIKVIDHPNKVKVSPFGFWFKHMTIFLVAGIGYVFAIVAKLVKKVYSLVSGSG